MKKEDLEQLLDILQGHRAKGRVQAMLKERELAYSGKWSDVRERIETANASGELPDEDLIAMVDEIEAYGAKHVFLLKCTTEMARSLKNQSHLGAAGRQMGLALGTSRFVPKPEKDELVTFTATPKEVILKWVRHHTWLEPRGEDDQGRFLFRKFERMYARAVTLMRIDLTTRFIDVRIDRHAHEKYDEEFARVKKRAKPLIDLNQAEQIDLVEVIRPLLESDEVRNRRGRLATSDGCTIEVASSEETKGFKENKFYKAGAEAAGDDLVGRLANVYFLPDKSNGKLESEVHVVIDEANQVVFPSTAVTRDEVEYVLQRLRSLAQAAP
jgi:hypothetical protein